jgi:hypothetical protein
MENFELGLGVGLAALAFWGFVATCVVAGVWNGIRKRDAQHETVRRLIESGQPLDQELMEKLSLVGDGGTKRHDRDFYVTGLWLLPSAVGLAVFALVLGELEPDAVPPILGASALVACIGIGALVAGRIAARWYAADGASAE